MKIKLPTFRLGRSAAGPTSVSPGGTLTAEQKLVYVIAKRPDGSEEIAVTTRAKAKDRRDDLPAAFQLEGK